jgi:hypothetical protein
MPFGNARAAAATLSSSVSSAVVVLTAPSDNARRGDCHSAFGLSLSLTLSFANVPPPEWSVCRTNPGSFLRSSWAGLVG